ncbi:acyltransferase [Tunturibacter psychrotolerans]|uniref:Acyltransferase n=1 Tax=Tunturiibacter psychrotolerans TaxID=3069686 RepID=A0AAU7ZSU6_9BACT
MSNYRGIQALRGVAACMVVVTHALQLRNKNFGGPLWENGGAGVDIFFVVSGFVMAIGRQKSASEFIKRRLFRIVPLYWLFTGIMLVKLFIIGLQPSIEVYAEHVKTPLSYIAASLLFIPYRNSLGIVLPILVVGWTLSFEMFFYLLMAAGIALQVSMPMFLSTVLISLSAGSIFRNDNWPAITVLLNPILLEFLAGYLLGLAVKRGLTINRVLSATLGIIGFAGIFAFSSRLEWGVCAFLIVQAAIPLEGFPKLVLDLGDSSYSLYLSHMLTLSILARVIIRVGIRPSVLAYITLQLVASAAVALAVYRFVEFPMKEASSPSTRPLPEIRWTAST